MNPSQVMRVYMWASFAIGLGLAVVFAFMVKQQEIEPVAGILLVICWNVLMMLILPLVLDWSERKYCKARFLELEEIAQNNPELQAFLEQQCRRLEVPNIKLAVVDSSSEGPFSYGLWRYNPRLIVPSTVLSAEEKGKVIPSIELELSRFARQEVTLKFLICGALQIAVQQLILWKFL